MALAEGTRVFVAYDLPGPELYHERYVLAACQCGQGYHIVLTPDEDIYPEQISLQNADLASFRLGVGGALPAGLTAANTYRFRRLPDAVMMQQYRRDARQAALAMAVVPGGAVMAAPVAAPVAVPLAGGAGVGADGEEVWVRVESHGEKLRGEVVELDGNEVLHDPVGIMLGADGPYLIRKMKRQDVDQFKGSEAAADARLLGISFQGISRAERQWRDVSKEVKEEKFGDWTIPGPRTTE